MKKSVNFLIEKAKKDDIVLAVAVFGSSLKCKGRDIDVCLFLNKNISNITMSKKRLEYIQECGSELDIHIFNQLPIYIKMRVLKDGKVLYCKDEKTLYEIAFSTLKEFSFYKKVYDMYLEQVKNG